MPVTYLWVEKFAVKRYFYSQSGFIFSLFGYAYSHKWKIWAWTYARCYAV